MPNPPTALMMMFYDGGFQYLPSFDHLIINFPVQRTAELMMVIINHYIDIPFFQPKQLPELPKRPHSAGPGSHAPETAPVRLADCQHLVRRLDYIIIRGVSTTFPQCHHRCPLFIL